MPFDVIQTTPLTGYAPNTAIGLDSTTPQLYIAGSDLMWRAVGGNELPIPVPIADGGTDATTAAGARTNLVAAESGVNSDITALDAITSTDSQTGIAITGPDGSNAITFTDGIHSGGITADATGFFNGLHCSGLTSTGDMSISDLLTVGLIQNGVSNLPVTINPNAGGADTSLLISGSPSAPISGQNLLGFGPNYFTQDTVGGSGSAAPPPTNPVLYVQLKAYKPDGTPVIVCFPCYATS